MSLSIRTKCQNIAEENWCYVGRNTHVSEFYSQLYSWTKERRFIVVREWKSEGAQSELFKHIQYTYRILTSDLRYAPEMIWRIYKKRATVEQRIYELKEDIGADCFCAEKFLRPGGPDRY
jgi:hypothetical protein